jgi:hypothetical protein
MKRLTVLTLLVLALFPLGVWATGPEESHRQAAKELLQTMDLEHTMLSGANAVLDAQAQSNPALAPYRDVIQKWMGKYLTWDTVGQRMIDLYTQEFTEAELRDIIAFYKTSTGKKALTRMPALLQQGMELGMEIAQQHKTELEEMIKARREELEKAKKP